MSAHEAGESASHPPRAFRMRVPLHLFGEQSPVGRGRRQRRGPKDLDFALDVHRLFTWKVDDLQSMRGLGYPPNRLAIRISGLPRPLASGMAPTITQPSFW